MQYNATRFGLPAATWRTSHACLFALLIVGCWGCGGDADVARVEGIVRLDGQPLSTGLVTFTPAGGRAATGEIQSDGSFTLGTYSESDGALIGTHGVAIKAFPQSSGPPDYDSDRPTRRSPASLVPLRYASPESSGLSFEVKPGKNYAEFDLTSE